MREESRGSTGWRDCRPASMVSWALHWVNSFDSCGRLRDSSAATLGRRECFETIETGCYGSFRQSEVDSTSFITHEKPA